MPRKEGRKVADNNKDEKHYYFYFKGLKLDKREANKAAFSVICGSIGAILVAVLSIPNRIVALSIITAFVLLGYVVGRKMF